MARPREYDGRVQRSFRIPGDVLAEAKQSAGECDVSLNLWVERAMRRYLSHLHSPALEEEPVPPWEWRR